MVFRQRFNQFKKSLIDLLVRWRWLILTFIGLSLLWVEVQEFLVLRVLNQAFHYFEVAQYAILLTSTGLLTELFARSNRAYRQSVKLLEYKHKLSQDLTSNDDWETLIKTVTELPGRIASVDETYLLTYEPISSRYDRTGHWMAEEPSIRAGGWDPMVPCEICLQQQPEGRSTFHECRYKGDEHSNSLVYSLVINNPNMPSTILKFRLKPLKKLSLDEGRIFKGIGDEIGVALQTSRDRRMLSDMQSAQVAMAERRIVSTYVHDELGQNLGYMHLKLDQLGENEVIMQHKDVRSELGRLRDIANESYEIVRDILKRMQPETIPHLTNLLREHARTISRRAKFELNFQSAGNPVHLPASTQQLIFFTFREILRNVEKHACAQKVDVLVTWSEPFLDITVADNGKGFDPAMVSNMEHFGLEIMHERISSINGRFMMNSSEDTGTVVSISIPLEAGKMVKV